MARRRLSPGFGKTVFPLAALALAGVASCQKQDNQDELQALLHDEDLTQITRGALSTGAAGAAGMAPTGVGGATGSGTAGTAGGTTGAGGSAGSAGRDAGVADGGSMTGSAGASGSGSAGASGNGGAGGSAGAGGDGGKGGSPGDGGMGGFGGSPFFGPLGQWSFDDCNPFRTNLLDSGPNGNTAFRSVGVTCAAGVSGQAVSLAVKEDIVYAPDQPSFTFEGGVTVAGWFNPTAVNKTRTLFRKRDKDTSSFALVLNGGKFQFVVNLGEGRAASVTAPKKAKVGVFQHVAGTYDGSMLKLYVDGKEVTTFNVAGAVPPGPGPVLMGNDGSERRFDGLIDNAFFDGRALSADEVLGLTCIRQTPTVVTTPRMSAPTPPNVPASFDIALTNNNSATCAAQSFQFEEFNFFPGITIDPPPFFPLLNQVASGETTHFTMTASASDSTEPGSFFLFFELFSFDGQQSFFFSDNVELVVAEPTGCHVSTPRELMIKNVSVVDDFARTTNLGPPDDPRSGVWTFKHLVENMAPTPADAPAMVEQMLQTFGSTQTVNGFSMAPRPGMQNLILSNWPRTPDGALDLTQPPLKLQAIVNRFDLRNLANGDAGEGRFVFAFMAPGNFFPLQATLILEYKLPATTDDDVLGWANAWHALGALPFSEDYNAALQAITERFAGRDARPGHRNGSAINAVRTNEIDFSDNGIWQLREFGLSADTGMLVPATTKLTPDLSFKNTDTLASFINANEAAIIAETHTVPEQLNGQPFLTGAVFNDLTTWFAPGINNNEARHHFAINTCNGCHSSQETGVGFLQISPRFPGGEASLSGFLTGTTISDPVTGQLRCFNDLGRRSADLRFVVCGDVPPPPMAGTCDQGGTGAGGSGGTSGTSGTGGRGGGTGGRGGGTGGAGGTGPVPSPQGITLQRGISRVH